MNTNLPLVDPIAAIEHWLDAMVIGQNLCPFANSARRKGLVRIVTADNDSVELLAVADALFEELDFDGILQLASFHPDYQFEGTTIDDVSNWTNRAPLPILHLLKEDSVTRAVDSFPDPDSIPARNIEKLQQLGLAGVLQILKRED